MTYSEMIDRIMPLVNDGSSLPFIISRTGGEWELDYLDLPPEKAAQHLADLREKDPYVIQFTGADFSRGSFPYVYDKVLTARLYIEYDATPYGTTNTGELRALAYCLEDNMSALSHKTTEYLASLDKPLAFINDIIPLSLKSEDEDADYDEDKAQEAIEVIENKIAELHNRKNEEIMGDMVEKRNIEGYEEMYSIQINGRLVFIGENPTAENRYMVCEYSFANPFGTMENVYTGVTNDFLEAIGEYTKNVQYYINCAVSDRDVRRNLHGVEPVVLTAADCVPNGMDADLEGKLIIIKPEVLMPEKQTSDYQLKICQGGFGSRPNSRGSAVFCADLFSGKESRFERYDVLGVADLSRLPEWAKIKLSSEKSFAQLHKECASAIDAAISEVRTSGKMAGTATYDFSAALDCLNEKFGKECVAEVLAAIVVKNDYDGRYSQKNKAWAKDFNTVDIEDVRHSIRYCTVNTHPAVLDGFVGHVRESIEKKPSFHDKLENAKTTAREAAKNNGNRGDKLTDGHHPKKRNDKEV